ncbi:kelch-like protein 20 [Hydra vulgaris]|nr:kelch-like protein 20 [Hydra vulgaris]
MSLSGCVYDGNENQMSLSGCVYENENQFQMQFGFNESFESVVTHQPEVIYDGKQNAFRSSFSIPLRLSQSTFMKPYFFYSSQTYPKSLLTMLDNLLKCNELCDIDIRVGSRRFRAHKVVLAACSSYFRAMFTREMAEQRQEEVLIQDIDEKAMELLIDFAYTGNIKIDEANVQIVLPAACLLQITEIQEACCEFLKKQLDPTNCIGIKLFADTHSCRDLFHIAHMYTLRNFQDVILNEEFLLLNVEQVCDIIQSDELNVISEEDVFRAVLKWVHFDLIDRRSKLKDVLQHVRLPILNAKFLVSVVSTDMLIKNDAGCRELVDEAKNYLLLPEQRAVMHGPRFKSRRQNKREFLFAVGGWCTGDAINSVERYDSQTCEWHMMCSMNKRRCGVGVAVLDDFLYAVGGHDGSSYLNSVERYDPKVNQWSSAVSPTSTCRTSVGVAVLDGYLYAVGGQDGVSCLNIVERYDSKANTWSRIAPMNCRRLGVAVAVLDGLLYAIGGSDGTSPLASVERFNPSTNTWTFVHQMSTKRKHLGSAVFQNFIYAVGGRDDTTELSSVEKFDPKTNKWAPVVALNSRRSGVGLGVMNGSLIAVGGFDGTSYLKSIEIYDPTVNQWKLHPGMNDRRLGGGVGVLTLHYSDWINLCES